MRFPLRLREGGLQDHREEAEGEAVELGHPEDRRELQVVPPLGSAGEERESERPPIPLGQRGRVAGELAPLLHRQVVEPMVSLDPEPLTQATTKKSGQEAPTLAYGSFCTPVPMRP